MRVVITGVVGGGKSTVLDELKKSQIRVIDECARFLITKFQKEDPNKLPWNNRQVFQDIVESMQIENHKYNPRAFFDRGLPDEIAYRTMYGMKVPMDLIDKCNKHRYDRVFVFPPWEEIYKQDDVRKESFQEACKIYDLLVEGYGRLGYSLIEVPKTSIKERTDFILSHTNNSRNNG